MRFRLNVLLTLGMHFDWRALRSLYTSDEQCDVLFCLDRLRINAHESATFLESLEGQGVAHPTELVSASSDMALLEMSVDLAQRQLAEA